MRKLGWLAGMVVMAAVAACSSGAPASSVPGATSGGPPTGSASASSPISPNPGGSSLGPSDSPTGPAATDASATLPDPCTLITKAEGGVAVTAPVSDGVPELLSDPALGTGRSCAFKVAGGGDGEATIMTYPNPGALYDAYKLQQQQFGAVKNLAGVGDKAFTVGNGECDVLKGQVLLIVKLFPADKFKTDPEPRTIALCKQAAARL